MYYLAAVRRQIFGRVFFVVSIIKSRKQMLKCFLQMTLRAFDIFFFSKKMINYLKNENCVNRENVFPLFCFVIKYFERFSKCK